MKLILATSGLPSTCNHGGAQTCLGVADAMRKRGHEVHVVSLYDQSDANPYRVSREDNARLLENDGVQIHYVDYRWDELAAQSKQHSEVMVNLYPFTLLKDAVVEAVRKVQADAIFIYHFEPLAALHGFHEIPKLVAIGDPTHTPTLARLQATPFFPLKSYLDLRKAYLRRKRKCEPLMRKLLSDCDVVGAFAGHYAEWLHQQGFKDACYFRTPLRHPALHESQVQNADVQKELRLLMMGDLTGTATRTGLSLLTRHVFPRLDACRHKMPVEIRIAGRGNVPDEMKPFVASGLVKPLGRVEPPDPEYLTADYLLVPTPVPLGIRVRILTSFAFGCPVIAHAANAQGIPEMRHGRNALIANSGPGLLRQIRRAAGDRCVRDKLSAAGRQTYELHFSVDAAVKNLMPKIEAIAKR